MATRTEEFIKVLTVEITILQERVEFLSEKMQLLRESKEKIAVLEHQVAEMTKTKELWGQRGWMVMTIALSAGFSFVAVILGGLLTFDLNSNRP